MHWTHILPQLHLSRLTNAWQSEGRPSSPRNSHPPALVVYHFLAFFLFVSDKPSPAESWLRLLCSALSCWNCRDLPFSVPGTTDKALLEGGLTDFTAGHLNHVKRGFEDVWWIHEKRLPTALSFHTWDSYFKEAVWGYSNPIFPVSFTLKRFCFLN